VRGRIKSHQHLHDTLRFPKEYNRTLCTLSSPPPRNQAAVSATTSTLAWKSPSMKSRHCTSQPLCLVLLPKIRRLHIRVSHEGEPRLQLKTYQSNTSNANHWHSSSSPFVHYRRSSAYCTPCIAAPLIRGGRVRGGSCPLQYWFP
jgi:hypothetical protein